MTKDDVVRQMASKKYWRYVEYVHQGRWKRAGYLIYVCDEIQHFLEDPNPDARILCLSMPPQHGKSLSITETLPSWYLGKHPEHRVIEVSYNDDFAKKFGRRNREKVIAYGDSIFNIRLSSSTANVQEWELDNGIGGMQSRGIGGQITGSPAELIIIDDPVKNRQEAESETYRDRNWDEWLNSIRTRLQAHGKAIVIMCLTGDTSILMSDGTEKALRNIGVGDSVATYKDGELAVSVVKNWVCQGPDLIVTLRMESGIIIKGNERHPFLVEREGYTEWVRIRDLRVGDRILKARRSGEHGKGSYAQKKTVISQQDVRGIVTHTTIRPDGQVEADLHRSTRNPEEGLDLNTDMGLALLNMTLCLQHKMENVPCVEKFPVQMYEHTGEENSASTMTTIQDECEGCCATTAISQWDMEKQKKNYSLPLSMFEIVPDSIVEIVESGYEDVFDMQIDGTENFIANGLVSHNTRWHEDDLIARIMTDETGVRYINIPCEAEEGDPLFREVGEALGGILGKDNTWLDSFKPVYMRSNGGSRVWSALFQGKPTAAEGNLIKRHWWRYYSADTCPAYFDEQIQSWDCTFKDSDGTDFVVGTVWGRVGANLYLLDLHRDRMDLPTTMEAMLAMTAKWPRAMVKLVEDKANGPAVIQMLRTKIAGMIPIEPNGGKAARVQAILGAIESGNVYLPDAEIAPWVVSFVDECSSFMPNTDNAHDDQVDSMSQALNRLVYTTHHKNPEAPRHPEGTIDRRVEDHRDNLIKMRTNTRRIMRV